MSGPPAAPADAPLSGPGPERAKFHDVFAAEWAYLRARRETVRTAAAGERPGARHPLGASSASPPLPATPLIAGRPQPGPHASHGLTGLAISGGGVRSAAFALGAVQRLAHTGLLARMDYLSTVSGGGYLGGALVAQLADPAAHVLPGAFPFAYRQAGEPPVLRHFRRHSNYLAPRGLASRAGLEMAATYLVGLVLNLLGFLGVFGLVVTAVILLVDIPGLLVGVFRTAGTDWLWQLAQQPWALGLLVAVLAGVTVPGVARRLPRRAREQQVARWFGASVLAVVGCLALLAGVGCFVAACRAGQGFGLQTLRDAGAWAWASWATLVPVLGFGARWIAANPRRLRRIGAILIEALALAMVGLLGALLTDALIRITEGGDLATRGFAARAGIGAVLRTVACGAVVLAAWGLRCVLNPGAWSVRAYYEDRLATAFVVRPVRTGEVTPDPGSGLPLAEVVHRPPGTPPLHRRPRADGGGHAPGDARVPYPIFNATANLLGAKDNLRRERGAELFQFAPFHCGSEASDYRATDRYAAGRLDLTTAVAVSGAAVSPQMGKYTRPVLAILIGLFNLKMGMTLPNPAARRWAHWPYPTPLLPGEWYWPRDEESARWEISDGGHYENLGLTALLRRKCRTIICLDAEADPDRSFGGLARAVRMARIDQRCHIQFPEGALRDLVPDPATGVSARAFAVGEIYYAGRDDTANRGTLVYIKASLLADVPVDLTHYQSKFPEFPHQGTGDQFFDESQFEAYRELGYQCVRQAYKDEVLAPHLRDPDQHLHGRAGEPAPADGERTARRRRKG